MMHKRWQDAFDAAFSRTYNTIHRLETNKLRNVAKMYAHLLYTDALPWTCLEYIKLNEDDTTSSSRIFIKVGTVIVLEMLCFMVAILATTLECGGIYRDALVICNNWWWKRTDGTATLYILCLL